MKSWRFQIEKNTLSQAHRDSSNSLVVLLFLLHVIKLELDILTQLFSV